MREMQTEYRYHEKNEMINKKLQLIFLVFLIISFPVLIYLSSWSLLFYDSNLYSQLLTKNNASHNAINLTNHWLNYFQNEETLDNIHRFTELEKSHMADVKNLVANLELFLIVLLVTFIALLYFIQNKSVVFFYGGILAMIWPIIFYLVPFEFTFDIFHKLFFVGNWQFSADSLLIRTFPANFFYDFAFRIFSLGFIAGVISTITSWKFCTS